MLPQMFLESLQFIHPKDIVELLNRDDRPKRGIRWVFKNELRPVGLYCYLGARFGQPNRIQNFLRKDDSDNLVHWEWFLRVGEGFVAIQGLNFRTEVWLAGVQGVQEDDDSKFVDLVKQSFAGHGKAMGNVRKSLEHWVEFVKPYQQLRRTVSGLMDELADLNLNSETDGIADIANHHSVDDLNEIQASWSEKASRYSRAFGLAFGLRSMLPVMAEAFVNLLLYILMKRELRGDERLRENDIRQQIDIRIRSLSHNCVGFQKHVDYTSEPCRFHTLVNERNDLLHGNVVVDKLRFNELFFSKKVPVFIEYLSMWDRSIGVAQRAVGMASVKEEMDVVYGLVECLLSCLHGNVREAVRSLADKFNLGHCLDDGRLGILFPNWLIDFAPGPLTPAENAAP